jgi:hypothetical protein
MGVRSPNVTKFANSQKSVMEKLDKFSLHKNSRQFH